MKILVVKKEGLITISSNGKKLFIDENSKLYDKLKELSKDDIKIYPNPAHESINISLSQFIINGSVKISGNNLKGSGVFSVLSTKGPSSGTWTDSLAVR